MKYDMHLLGWGVITMEPDYQIREHYHSANNRRWNAYVNPELDRLIDEAVLVMDRAKAREMYHRHLHHRLGGRALALPPLPAGADRRRQADRPGSRRCLTSGCGSPRSTCLRDPSRTTCAGQPRRSAARRTGPDRVEPMTLRHIVAKRSLHSLLLLFGVSLVVFLLLHVVPGDPAQILLGDQATPERVAEVRRAWASTVPWSSSTGGSSRAPSGATSGSRSGPCARCLPYVLERLPATLELSLGALPPGGRTRHSARRARRRHAPFSVGPAVSSTWRSSPSPRPASGSG